MATFDVGVCVCVYFIFHHGIFFSNFWVSEKKFLFSPPF